MRCLGPSRRGCRPALRNVVTALLLGTGTACQADEAGALRNWFNDPFERLSAEIAPCPEPLGPRITARERLTQSHHRAEKGTTCHLAGACDEPNAYLYDAGIAAAAARRLREAGATIGTSLWLTVQARVVYVEGCVRDPAGAQARLEALVRAVPQVSQAIAVVYGGRGRPPYATLPR